MSREILITGATGYVGTRLAALLLEKTERRLILSVRSSSVVERYGLDALSERYPGRIRFEDVDFDDPKPLTLSPESIDVIVHAAAITKFNVDEVTAQRVNVDGARRVFEFAARCPHLRRLVHVSTLYAAGLATGVVSEAELSSGAGFANHYERSKWTAESLLFSEYRSCPFTIARLGTLVADDASGAVSQYNAFHNTLKLYYYGLLSLAPGCTTVPLYLLTGEECSEALLRLILADEVPAVVHLANPAPLTLGAAIDLAFSTFEAREGFRKRRVLRPLFVDQGSFDLLVQEIEDAGAGNPTYREAMGSVAPFSRQLFTEKRFSITDTTKFLAEFAWCDARELVENTTRRLVETRWGRTAGDS